MTINLILCAVIVIQSIIHFIDRRNVFKKLVSQTKNTDTPPFHCFSSVNKNKDTLQHIPSAHRRVLKNWKKSFKAGDE